VDLTTSRVRRCRITRARSPAFSQHECHGGGTARPIIRELRERTREARAAYQESQQLQRALEALDTDVAQAPKRSEGRRRGRLPARKAAGRARRGANRKAIVAAIGERPGLTAREIAESTGIARNTVASTVTRLSASGELVRIELPAGGVGFRAA
jgi:CRP-like cAMP-binding protein